MLEPICQAVKLAALICREVQKNHIFKREKQGHEPVTIADYASQALLCRAIQIHFPDDAVISEENGEQFRSLLDDELRQQIAVLVSHALHTPVSESHIASWLDHGKTRSASRTWIIDPLDGTKGFLALKNYVIAVGLMENGKPASGVIGAPAYPRSTGVLFHAENGHAFREPLFNVGQPQPIAVSRQQHSLRGVESSEDYEAARVQLGKVYRAAGIDAVHEVDGQEKQVRIAAGDADVFMRLPRLNSNRPFMIWDYVPGIALVEAAGGRVTDIDGSPLDYSHGKTLHNRGVVATNGLVHDRVLDAIREVLDLKDMG